MDYLDLDGDSGRLEEKIDEKEHDLFKEKPSRPPTLISWENKASADGEKEAGCEVTVHNIWDLTQVSATLEKVPERSSQMLFVRHDRSWRPLNISHEAFKVVMRQYKVFPQFWKQVLVFGRKLRENEFQFPGFRARHTRDESGHILESTYILRRVEDNHRELTEGQHPWKKISIRQTAIYHQLRIPRNTSFNSYVDIEELTPGSKSTFVVIAPSQNLEKQLSRCFAASKSHRQAISPWNLHRVFVEESLRGWMEYIACLEDSLKEQTARIVLAKIGSEEENLSPLTDFTIDILDPQTFKLVEDAVIELQVIMATSLSTVTRIRNQCKKCCAMHTDTDLNDAEMDLIMDEFDEYVRETETYVERAKILKESASSTAKLLSDLLNYEQARALRDLARESQLEGKAMHKLTERSTKDAAAVKILTVITLIYLPTTIVANFFSTQFVQTDEHGQMRLSQNSWLLAAIAIPLTIITICSWWGWVHFTQVSSSTLPREQPDTQRRPRKSLMSFFSRKQATPDTECGITAAEQALPQFGTEALGLHHSAVSTWSTTATTVKA